MSTSVSVHATFEVCTTIIDGKFGKVNLGAKDLRNSNDRGNFASSV